MGLIDELRLDIGDDESIIWPASGILPSPTPITNLDRTTIDELRLDIGDDEDVVYSSISGSYTPTIFATYDRSVIDDVRVDIGDDESVVFHTISGVIPPPPIAIFDYSRELIDDIRLDIGDDDGINYNEPTGLIPQSQVWNSIVINNNYPVLANDTVILVNPIPPQSVTITLPPVTVIGKIIIIKDMAGIAGTYPINITAGSYTIDGFNAVLMTQDYQAYSFFWNGVEWNII